MSPNEQARQLLQEMEELEREKIDQQTYAQILEKFRALVTVLDEARATGTAEDASES
jgi:hypothetical protein